MPNLSYWRHLMWARDLSGIRFTGERERNISGAFILAVNDWAERTHTERNIASLTCSGCILFCLIWLLTYTYNIYIYIYIYMYFAICLFWRHVTTFWERSNWFPLEMFQIHTECIYNCKGQGFFICHIINYTGYNQKWNVDQIRSAQWTVQRIKIIYHTRAYI